MNTKVLRRGGGEGQMADDESTSQPTRVRRVAIKALRVARQRCRWAGGLAISALTLSACTLPVVVAVVPAVVAAMAIRSF